MYLNLVGKFCSLMLHAFRAPGTCKQILILPFARSKRLLSKSRFSRSNKSQLVALKLPACTTSMISFTTLFLFYSLLFSLSTILHFHSNTVLLSVQVSMILILEYIHRYNTQMASELSYRVREFRRHYADSERVIYTLPVAEASGWPILVC